MHVCGLFLLVGLVLSCASAQAQDSALPAQETGDVEVPPPGSLGDAGTPEPGALSYPTATVPAVEPDAPSEEEMLPAVPATERAPFAFSLNTEDKGQLVVVIRNGKVFARRDDLFQAGLRNFRGVEENIDGSVYVSLESLAPKVRVELDERSVALRMFAPVEMLPRKKLDFDGTPLDVVYQEPTSGFINYAARTTDLDFVDLYGEMGASSHGNLLFTSAYMSSSLGPRRGLSNFTINDRMKLRRLTLGDSLVVTGPLGSGAIVGGLTLSRTYALSPYTLRTPRVGYVGSTLTPATLDVYVNGMRVRSETIAPGTFELGNLRVNGGRGVATYVIRDVFGQQTTITSPFYISSSVLAKGLDEFTYSAAVMRENVGIESFDYTRPVFMATHRRGVTNNTTLSGRAELAEDLATGGPAVTMLTPIGEVELDLAASYQRNTGPGAGAFASYSFMNRHVGAGLYAILLTDHYATLNLDGEDDRSKLDVGVYDSIPIGNRVTFSTSGQLTRSRDAADGVICSAQVTTQILSELMLFVTGNTAKVERVPWTWDVFASLSFVIGQTHNVALSTQVSQTSRSATLAASRSTPVGRGYGYRATATLGDIRQADALAQYQTLSGRYGVGFRGNELEQHVDLEASGALVIVPGVGLFPTLPVQQSFGVIRLPGVKGVRGYVNNQEVGRTDRNGNLVVPSLLSYYGNRLGIAQEDVPMKYDVQSTEMTLAPPQRGAAVAEFNVSIPHFYRGRVVLLRGSERVVPQFGQLWLNGKQGEVVSPLGEGGEFELEGIGPGLHPARVEYLGASCHFELDAKNATDTVIELGEILCSPPAEASEAPSVPEAPDALEAPPQEASP